MSYIPTREILHSLGFESSQTNLPTEFRSEWERIQYMPWSKGGLIQHEYHVEKVAITNSGLTLLTAINATVPVKGTQVLFKGSLPDEDFFKLLLIAVGW
jgi:hypothetical protein